MWTKAGFGLSWLRVRLVRFGLDWPQVRLGLGWPQLFPTQVPDRSCSSKWSIGFHSYVHIFFLLSLWTGIWPPDNLWWTVLQISNGWKCTGAGLSATTGGNSSLWIQLFLWIFYKRLAYKVVASQSQQYQMLPAGSACDLCWAILDPVQLFSSWLELRLLTSVTHTRTLTCRHCWGL